MTDILITLALLGAMAVLLGISIWMYRDPDGGKY